MPSASLHHPRITYLFSSPHGDITPDEDRLSGLLPEAPSDLEARTRRHGQTTLTFRQYFEVITAFIQARSYQGLIEAFQKKTGARLEVTDIGQIVIRTEKHGALYHIASIEVAAQGITLKFVVTTAVSPAGQACLQDDFSRINGLNARFRLPYLPRMYGKRDMTCPIPENPNLAVRLYLGDWLDGYHEFHLSIDAADQRQQIILWDTDNGYRYLSPRQGFNLYREVAKILTLYFDLETFQEISDWHHAAGDFIARTDGDDVHVRLVTVRGYEPMIALPTKETTDRVTALVYFLAHLSLRMRMDRLDGTGGPVWADAHYLPATLDGFFQALTLKGQTPSQPSVDVIELQSLLKTFTPGDWAQILGAALRAYPQAEADVPIISQRLDEHAREISDTINGCLMPETG